MTIRGAPIVTFLGWSHSFSKKGKAKCVNWRAGFTVNDEGITSPSMTICYEDYRMHVIDIVGIKALRALRDDLSEVINEYHRQTGD